MLAYLRDRMARGARLMTAALIEILDLKAARHRVVNLILSYRTGSLVPIKAAQTDARVYFLVLLAPRKHVSGQHYPVTRSNKPARWLHPGVKLGPQARGDCSSIIRPTKDVIPPCWPWPLGMRQLWRHALHPASRDLSSCHWTAQA